MTTTSGAPRLQAALEALRDPVIDVETSWEDLDVTGSVDIVDADGWDVRGCRLTGLDLTGQVLDGAQLRDAPSSLRSVPSGSGCALTSRVQRCQTQCSTTATSKAPTSHRRS